MNIETFCLLSICCGVLGIFLKNNISNILISITQIIIGIHPFLISFYEQESKKYLSIMIFLLVISLGTFLISLSVLMFRRRSTTQIDEFTELRG